MLSPAAVIPKAPRIRDAYVLHLFRLQHLGEPCQECELRPGIHVHHKVYRSKGGGDIPSNLAWLCGICHDAAHGIVRVDL
jgi:5-methylcytosine-specific restriction endonuclease McrA